MSNFNFSYSFGTYDAFDGFNSIGGSGYAGQNVSYQGTTATGFDAVTSNPFLTNTTTTGFTLDSSIVGTANYQVGVDYTNNAVTGFANPNTGGTQALSLDNTYYTLQTGNDAYLTSQYNAAGSIATIQTATATVIALIQAAELIVDADTSPGEIGTDAQSIIDQRVADIISQTGTITAAQYAQIQQQVVSSTLVQTQTSTVDAASIAFGGGGGGGIEGDEPPPNDINASAEDVSSADPASFGADTTDAEFSGTTETGLRTVPEDQDIALEDTLDVGEELVTDETTTTNTDQGYYPQGTPYDDDGNLNPGWAINPETGEPYYVGDGYIDPETLASAAASRESSLIQAATNRARSQAAIEAQRKQANEGDWRVKLRLAGAADYLYKDPEITQDGLLYPLAVTDGVVFPYTPQISTAYAANYSSYDLTHSNYRGQFYQNSYVDDIQIQATFTAQDTQEANYLLAVIHFFRSATKMFYGQDAQRGAPPPMVFLQGLGEFQFNLHPCVIKNFQYVLPNNVDYIRARTANIDGTNLLQRRDRSGVQTTPAWASLLRLANASLGGLKPGALSTPPAAPTLGTNNPTYVPTKIDLTITLLPVQTRQQVSKQFSVKQFANGDLLKGGFW